MIRNTIVLRTVAIFLMLETFINTLTPAISFALTAGPTAPEFSSFEPVDTTDMVNLLTGDLAYNTPIVEVPGPSGGYPLSLSYHAGIQPNIEASWVGLGWTLNPGSITRLVNGYPDDHKEVDVVDHFYWDGFTRTTYGIGVSVGYGRGASVTAGLSFTQDSRYGFSVNPYLQGSVESIAGTGIGISANSVTGSAQLTAPGMQYLSMIENKQYSFTKGFLSGSISSSGVNIGVNAGGATMNFTINSKGIKPKLGISGISKGVSREGNINRENSNFGITIPTPWGFGVNLSRDYMRVWIDENATVQTNGALYYPTTQPDYTYLNQRSFDTYDLLYNDQGQTNLDPEVEGAGSFIDYDDFTVQAQGLSGSIRPYHYYEFLYRQNRNDDGTPTIRSVPMGVTGNKLGFRFVNDFSNRFLYNPSGPDYQASNFDMEFATANIIAGLDGQGYTNNILAGSKYIQHFTNNEISTLPQTVRGKGFIEATGYQRSASGPTAADQVGSFRIINESGVSYHFSIPVYSYGEYSYSEKIKPEGGALTYHEVTKNTKYAYTWLLTGITGPDYVDRGGIDGVGNGVLDENDYGYWVDFGYKKWEDDYSWRNPAEGFNNDIDHNFKNFAFGKKETYYLDFIRTASHIALFEKSTRVDGKGVIDKNGGFSSASATSLQLDQVYLLTTKGFTATGGSDILSDWNEYRTAVLNNSVRSIKFNYDSEYTLCPNTINSFHPNSPEEKKGKLSLTSLRFLGRGGSSLLPDMKFGYEVKNPKPYVVRFEQVSGTNDFSFFAADFELEVGDIVKFKVESQDLYGLILETNFEVNRHKIRIIEGNSSSLEGIDALICQTKNPPFNKDKVDVWGLYKSDFLAGSGTRSKNTTTLSAKSVDVWSLRSITTMLGAKINLEYEPDYYDEVVYNGSNDVNNANATQQALRMKNVVRIDNNLLKIFFHNDGFDLHQIFAVNEKVDAVLIGAYKAQDLQFSSGGSQSCPCPPLEFGVNRSFTSQSSVTVNSIVSAEYAIVINATNNQFSPSLNTAEVNNTNYSSACEGYEPANCTYTVVPGQPSFFAGGLVFTPNNVRRPGGIRVKSIEIDDLHQTKRNSHYVYDGGVTSYEPAFIPPFEMVSSEYDGIGTNYRANQYEKISSLISQAVSKRYSDMLNITRELPGPGVMYPTVEVRGSVKINNNEVDDPTHKVFQFQTLTRDMVRYTRDSFSEDPTVGGLGQPPIDPDPISGLEFQLVKTSDVMLEDLTAAVGGLKSIKTYNSENQLLEESNFTYLHDAHLDALGESGYISYENALTTQFQSQGIINESFADARVAKKTSSENYDLIGVLSNRRTYPSVMIGQSVKNYKTGIVASTSTKSFDFFSGAQTETLQEDGYGNVFVTKTEPAYRVYMGMGLGMYSNRKNMLSQEASSYSYKVDPTNHSAYLGLAAASIQTWSSAIPALEPGEYPSQATPQTDIWRKHASFTFAGNNEAMSGDGLLPITSLTSFNAWNVGDNVSAGWQKNGEVKLYDVHSHALEAVDINEQYSAVVTSNRQDQVYATASYVRYGNFAYAGAEDDLSAVNTYSGNVRVADGIEVTATSDTDQTTVHTGQKALRLVESDKRTFQYVLVGKAGEKYQASVWMNSMAGRLFYSIGGITTTTPAAPDELRKAGSWYLVTIDLPLLTEDSNLMIWCATNGTACHFDDFRVHPIASSMTSYVYNKWGDLSHIIDNNNLYSKFEYDEMGRLKSTHRETLSNGVVKINEQHYKYANQ